MQTMINDDKFNKKKKGKYGFCTFSITFTCNRLSAVLNDYN